MDQVVRKKLDARARFQLPRGLNGDFEVLIRTTAPFNQDQRAEFVQAGGNLRTIMGNILTATLNISSLEAVARLPFVRKIELSRTLFHE
jgi:hypothetical protein